MNDKKVKKEPLEWEVIDSYHTRARVFGGWIIKVYEHREHSSCIDGYWAFEQAQVMQMSIAFVPDLKNEWVL